jgi:hypothetical protein
MSKLWDLLHVNSQYVKCTHLYCPVTLPEHAKHMLIKGATLVILGASLNCRLKLFNLISECYF